LMALVELLDLTFPIVVFHKVLDELPVAIKGDSELCGCEKKGLVHAHVQYMEVPLQISHVIIITGHLFDAFGARRVEDRVVSYLPRQLKHKFLLGAIDLVYLRWDKRSALN
jgi:hypothetical protein